VLKTRADDDLGRNLADEDDALVTLRRNWRLIMVDVRVALDMVDLIARPAIRDAFVEDIVVMLV